MARDLPSPTPEGRLIRRVRESLRPRLPVAAAAERAGVGEATWGNTERGYRTMGRNSPPQPFRPSAQSLAHMAHAIGLTPADLEEVGREDAAVILTEMRGPELQVEVRELKPGRVFFTVPPDLPEEDRQAIVRWAEDMARHLDERRKDSKSDG
ncbi:helix-turn-helix transcriptional regulator [Microbispora amethystogenes]|uniref:helix-turn-helix domain-containing protein n=1 Tax=Microbispora amethystogenes TaxID=1427754 RepID=UPI0033D12E25